MTIEDKRAAIAAACELMDNCSVCPLDIAGVTLCYSGKADVEKNYEIMFCNRGELNGPYWKHIEDIATRQRLKGVTKYNRGLEDNPMVIRERLEYLEEELIDALFYIEHIKEFLK